MTLYIKKELQSIAYFFNSIRFSPETYLGYNKDGIIPINAKYAITNLKKVDNPNGYENYKIKYSVPITNNYCARIIQNGKYDSFRDYVPSQNYDCIHFNLNNATSKINITGCKTGAFFFFSSSQYNADSFVGYNSNGKVPKGAKYVIVNLKKENNTSGYNNLRIEEISEMSSDDWLKPNDSTGLNNWSEWQPCPGTRLYQLWRLLKYAKGKGVALLTISQNLDRMANKVEGGYFVRKRQNAFDKFDTDYYIEDILGNIYLHRSK